MYISGVSRISASRVLKVRPHTKNGGGGGGGSPLQVRYTKSEGGGGGGASPLQVRYTKSAGGIRFRSDMKSGGGGGPVHFRSDIRKVEGRYLCLAQRKYLIVNYKRLQF